MTYLQDFRELLSKSNMKPLEEYLVDDVIAVALFQDYVRFVELHMYDVENADIFTSWHDEPKAINKNQLS